jgi:hypothetical protein
MGDAAEKLYDEAMKLPESERRALAVRVLATVAKASAEAPEPPRRRTVSWETFESLRGVVNIGGNALEDCERLYDG